MTSITTPPPGIVQNAHPGSVVPVNQQLSRNPQLPEHPLGAYTDSQYEAAIASLRSQVSRAYADVLKRLGFMGDDGQFVPGEVEANAWKQMSDLDRSKGLAAEEVTNRAQQEGTLFSGIRGLKQGRAEHPFVSAMADLDVQTPLQLNDLYENAAGLIEDYVLQQNKLLADAAARRGGDTPAGEAPPAPLVSPEVSANVAAAGSEVNFPIPTTPPPPVGGSIPNWGGMGPGTIGLLNPPKPPPPQSLYGYANNYTPTVAGPTRQLAAAATKKLYPDMGGTNLVKAI